jgi:CheY-like chemotaxis protein
VLAVIVGGLAGPAAAQDLPAKKPLDVWREIRDLMNEGRYEVAAESIVGFLNLSPTDQDYLDIESKYGPTTFIRLRNIPRWYDDAKKEAEFKAGPLKRLIDASLAANAKLLRDPKRIERFVFNLGASREEYQFAVQELKRSGDFVVPIMVTTLRSDDTPELRQGILSAIRELGAEVVPGFLAATDGLSDELKIGIFQSIAARPDILALVDKVDTDITPSLWYFASSAAGQPALKQTAASLLRQLTGGSADLRLAAVELVGFATPLYQRKARFANFERVKNRVLVWQWDATAGTVRSLEMTPSQAEEWFGLKYLRWAVERQPGYAPAEELFLSFAIERGVERSNFGDLARGDPGVYRVAVAAPAATLTGLLETALAENRTALALGLIQVLGDRAERAAATPEVRGGGATRPAPLVRALTYADPRVQFAAAVALLRTPPTVPAGANARVVEILMRAITGDAAENQGKGRALLADPSTARSDQVAVLLRGLGYSTEQFGTGRELLRRIRTASDFDLVLLDRHIAGPELRDILAQLNSDANFGRRPVLVIASPDAPRPLGIEQLLLRLALLVAATETEDIPVPGPVVIDTRKNREEIADDRRRNAEDRDRAFARVFRARLARLQRLVDASGIVTTRQIRDRVDLRLPQLTYAGLIAEYAPPPETAPMLYRQYDKVATLVRAQSNLDPAVENLPNDALVKIIIQLESALTPALRRVFNQLQARVDPDALGIRIESNRDPAVEQALARVVKTAPGTVVIPEPHSRVGFDDDVRSAYSDPAQLPRDPAEKKAAAKAAVDWLRRMASGAVPGYDVRPAGPALRKALDNDELAEGAVEALAHVPTAEAQQDLLKVALGTTRPAALRLKAAEAVIWHIQQYGRLITEALIGLVPRTAADEKDPDVKTRLEAIRTLLVGTPSDLSDRIKNFQPGLTGTPALKTPPAGPKEPSPPAPKEKKDE